MNETETTPDTTAPAEVKTIVDTPAEVAVEVPVAEKPTSLEQPPAEHTTVDSLGTRPANELTQPKEKEDAAT